MKAEELMLGDWVIRKGIPQEPMQIAGLNTWKGLVYMNFTGLAITEKIENIEPIPLTEEILEKNEFKKWTWWKYHKDDTITYAVGGGCHVEIEERMINGKNEKEFNLVQSCNDSGDYGYESDYICDVQYVHKLQNALKVLEIEKEIVL